MKLLDLFEIKDEYKDIPVLKKMGVHANPGSEAFGTPVRKPNAMAPDDKANRAFTRGFKTGFGDIPFASSGTTVAKFVPSTPIRRNGLTLTALPTTWSRPGMPLATGPVGSTG